jgi:hypothetical protein
VVHSWQRQEIFSSPKMSRPRLGLIQLPTEWVPGALPQAVKQPGHEPDHQHLVPRLRVGGAIPVLHQMHLWHAQGNVTLVHTTL